MFAETLSSAHLIQLEEDVRRFWRRHGVPEAVRAWRSDGLPLVLYQEPLAAVPQARGDSVRLLATADLLARHRAMRGDHVYYQGGWACHGLPIEIAVEQALDPDLADYDLAYFNEACRSAAVEGIRQGEALAERLAAWVDPDLSYATMSPGSVGMVWAALRRLWDAGKLRKERRVVSVCPRCATPLSSSEAASLSTQVEGQAIWLRLPWAGEPDAYLVVWTALPWTLLGMVALALHPEATYVLVEPKGRLGRLGARLVVAESALERTFPGGYIVIQRRTGRSLGGVRYRPPFTFLLSDESLGRVLLSEQVPLHRGTGVLPVTPTIDNLSLTLAEAHNLPTRSLLDAWGHLDDTVARWRGLSPVDAQPLLVEDLEIRGLVLRNEAEIQTRSLCPHCTALLLPEARSVWLVDSGQDPWIVGRDRAWGTPLPVWTCQACGNQVCVAGLDDLAHRSGLDAATIDPHRPAVDRIAFACESCGGVMRREVDVIDAAFDAAVLPGAHAPGGGPAEIAVGLGSKDVGWLGDLGELTALLQDELAWLQACAVRRDGPGLAGGLERSAPGDALRWAAYTGQAPERALETFLLPLLSLVGGDRVGAGEPPLPRCRSETTCQLLDHWFNARLHQAVAMIGDALEVCQPKRAAEALGSLVRDLAERYLPCRPEPDRDWWQILLPLLAPFAPHLAEAIHRSFAGREAESIHQVDWPAFDPDLAESALLTTLSPIWQLAECGWHMRAQAGFPSTRRLPCGLVTLQSVVDREVITAAPFADLLADLLGVSQVQFTPAAASKAEWHLALNRERVSSRHLSLEQMEAALSRLEPAAAADLASHVWRGLSASLEVEGQAMTLLPDEIMVSFQARPGWLLLADEICVVALQVSSEAVLPPD